MILTKLKSFHPIQPLCNQLHCKKKDKRAYRVNQKVYRVNQSLVVTDKAATSGKVHFPNSVHHPGTRNGLKYVKMQK